MGVCDYSAEAVASSYAAVVRTLVAWVAVVGPAKRPRSELGRGTDEGVFLLKSKPDLLIKSLVENLFSRSPEVGVGWLENLA